MTEKRPFALILAGGAGTRFWPASRTARPKQLLPLAGETPLLRRTILRVLPVVGDFDHVVVASGRHLAEATRAVVPELPEENLLLEPVPRNTAPCIGWAAARIARRDPNALVMVLPSDHVVDDEEGFRRTLSRALEEAARGIVTTIGVRPTRAETGFGYIEVGAEEAGRPGAHAVAAFVEKPDAVRAEAFVKGGRHLWNAGMFFFRASDMLGAVRAHAPDLAAGLDELEKAHEEGREAETLDEVFASARSVSIDHAVMEKLERIAVVPGDFGWSDIGSWEALWEFSEKDGAGNAGPEPAVFVDSEGNLVVDLRTGAAKAGTIALLGARGLVVVATDDALMVMPRDRAQDVRMLVEELRRKNPAVL